MKRILLLALLILLLCGCAEPQTVETTVPPVSTTVPAEPTEPVGIYVPFSDLEIRTNGAVRYFLPEDTSCYGIRLVDGDILAFSGVETTTLTRYTGEKLYPVAGAQLDCWIDPEDSSFQISSNGITYYNPETREVVFLDNDLKEVRRLELSADMVGKPVLSANRMQVYYCTPDAVRVYDTTTGLEKLLKVISYAQQSVEDVLLNGTVLRCSLVDERGEACSIFLSTETGELLYEAASASMGLTTEGERFYANIRDGILQLLVFGQEGEMVQVLSPADVSAWSWFQETTHTLVTATVTEEATRLDSYDLATGMRCASVELLSGIFPRYVVSQPDSGNVFVMAYDYMAEAPVILAWDKEASPVEDDTVYVGPRYTAEDPDVQGLEECAALARQIGETHDVNILVGVEAVAQQPGDYTLEMEYQTHIIREQLEAIENLLSQFPDRFFSQLYGDINICIVRSIQGNAESGSLESAQGLQFWSGENAYLALAAGDTLPGAFYHEMFHVLDSKILSETRVYYHWNNLNPQGCKYFEDYTSYLEVDVSRYLQDEDRAFIDAYSMCYPREDRARIMEYACQEGNEQYFQSETMQKKLKTLCEGIRKAFGLEKYPNSFLWEQYLNEPLKIK